MPSYYPGTPPYRILSWSQMVREADPNFTRGSLQSWSFEFSNGRLFLDWLPLYGEFDIIDLLLQTGPTPQQQGEPVLLLNNEGYIYLEAPGT